MPVAELLEASRHGSEGEVGRVAVRDLVPGERRRDARIGRGPHRVRRGDGAVLGVLVVVDEYAVALLFPPFAGGEPGGALFDLARERERRAAYLVEAPAPLDAHADMHAARARGLGPAGQVEVVQDGSSDLGGLFYLSPFDAGDRIEV